MPDRLRSLLLRAWLAIRLPQLPRWWPVAVVALALAALLLAPEVALARGGGGGHSGGGGGHSGGGGISIGGGSHSGGGISGGGSTGGGGGFTGGGFGGSGVGYRSGGFGGLWFLPFFFGGGGSFLFLILILVLLSLFVRSRVRSGPARNWPEPYQPAALRRFAGPQAALAEIQSADPGFDRDTFLKRVEEAFLRLQAAWQDRDLAAARPYMGEGVYLSWQSQLEQMRALHKKNVIEGLEVLGAAIVTADHGARFEHITVRIDARAADYEIDERTGATVFGDHRPAEFSEYWTFERTAGTVTPASGGILNQVCPVCGAPLSINEIGDCDYCGSAVTSGRYDWVLSRIEQPAEWDGRMLEPGGPADLPAIASAATGGIAAISAADPAFSAETFLQRAEMAFFLIEKARQSGNLDSVRPYFQDPLFADWSAEVARMAADGQRSMLENLNVQGMEVAEAHHDPDGDTVKVRVDAVAARYLVAGDSGEYLSGDRTDRAFAEYWTFHRPAGATTPADGGVLARKCPQCGRPLSLTESGECSGCGASIVSGHFDWALSSVEAADAVLPASR